MLRPKGFPEVLQGRGRRHHLVVGIVIAAVAIAVGSIPASALANSQTPTTVESNVSATSDDAGITPVMDCSDAAAIDVLNVRGANAQITSAKSVAASENPEGKWPACKVQGIIVPETHFTIYLPTQSYAGDYLQNGCGGYCGKVSLQVAAASGCHELTSGGFAVAADDEGHEGGGFTTVAFQDPELKAVFGYKSEHQLSLVSKAILRAFYGKPPRESYFDGCSDGGREALMEAQRYPTDFDGIIAGSPASIQTELNAFEEAWNAQANTAPDGSAILTAEVVRSLHSAVLKACGGSRAVELGYLSDPLACDWDPASIRCPAGHTSDSTSFCLSKEQVGAVRKIYRGPTTANGKLLYPGYEVRGSELNWIPWLVPASGDDESTTIDAGIGTGAWQSLVSPTGTFDGKATYRDVKFTEAEFRKVTSANNGELDATDPDLSAFEKAGGKLILWAGYADPAINPVGTLSYYKAVVARSGGLRATEQFARLFLLPGVAHCGGGQGPDQMNALGALTSWVTQGKAPSHMLTSQVDRSGTVTATRPVYAYPYIAADTTGGPLTRASSYTPVVSQAERHLKVSWLGSFRSGFETVSGWVHGRWVTRPAHLHRPPRHHRS